MDLGLKGKVAIVTGASKGLGKATARCLSGEGALVWICSRDAEQIQAVAEEISAETGNPVHARACDVTDPDSINAFIDEVAAESGGIDILVNNAGRAQWGGFAQITDEMWKEDLEIKLFAHVRCCRAIIPHMKERGGGRIINMNAILGKQPSPAILVTSVDRAACINFSKVLAQELASDHITVNSINLGLIESDQWVRMHAQQGAGESFEEFLDQKAKQNQIPLGRLGKAEEVAALVTFLASEPAAYITGTSVEIDGGLSKYI